MSDQAHLAMLAFCFVMMFVNPIMAARRWAEGRHGWAGAYVASFAFGIIWWAHHGS